jgi:hypothetical protein
VEKIQTYTRVKWLLFTRVIIPLAYDSCCNFHPLVFKSHQSSSLYTYTLDQESTIYFVFEVKTSLGAPHALLSFEFVFYFGITYLKGVF